MQLFLKFISRKFFHYLNIEYLNTQISLTFFKRIENDECRR